MSGPAQRGLLRGLVITAVLAVLALGAYVVFASLIPRSSQDGGSGQVTIGGPFELVDHEGRTVTDRDFAGRLMLIYFGFTNCPDICPTGLQTMAIAMDELGAAGEKVQPLLITVDPERDTPAVMKEYVQAFHERLVGLTGTPEQIAKVAREYRVYYQKVALKDSSLGYSVDHSGFIYLMDGEGKYLTHFRHDTTPEQMAERIKSKL
ncbi:MAG TPA: SCO family protein [Ferrovibrio sp.]|jgi:protein SCO1/2|uniref:SCO family protein n=1 Tax=Ferrovibrio sp. TaxID=1917215 RepID=UPI002B4B8057|nr:SCO family protein [Ferrovibrio sp.]HLT77032.1 SCO family protein [Ferrovibrio sp.]